MLNNDIATNKLLDPQHITITDHGYSVSVEIMTDLATDEEVLQMLVYSRQSPQSLIRNIATAIAKRAAERGYRTEA